LIEVQTKLRVKLIQLTILLPLVVQLLL